MEDAHIIELYFKRDELALTETDRKYGAFCHRVAMNILSIREDAEECVNDAYHAAWQKMPPEFPDSLRTFLGRITRNLSISRFRKNRAAKRYNGLEAMLSELDDCVPSSDNVESMVEAQQLSELISRWLDTLPAEGCTSWGVRFRPAGENGWVKLHYWDSFGVCGTGLEEHEITLENGMTAFQGTYDNHTTWDFISIRLDKGNVVAMTEGVEAWWPQYDSTAMEILGACEMANHPPQKEIAHE